MGRSPPIDPLWYLTKDGDPVGKRLFDRHYSRRRYRDRQPKLFVGPGEKVVLRTWCGSALFAWRVFIDDAVPKQTGINCAIFRNETSHQSSELIRQADAIADCLWPHQRHYTYVDTRKVKSRNHGWCFICAGWRKCGFTKTGKLILERPPNDNPPGP